MPSSGFKTCARSEEHTSELQSHSHLVCRLLLEKKKTFTSAKDPSWLPWECVARATRCLLRMRGAPVVFLGEGASPATAFSSRITFFFFNDTATTEIYLFSLQASLPI